MERTTQYRECGTSAQPEQASIGNLLLEADKLTAEIKGMSDELANVLGGCSAECGATPKQPNAADVRLGLQIHNGELRDVITNLNRALRTLKG